MIELLGSNFFDTFTYKKLFQQHQDFSIPMQTIGIHDGTAADKNILRLCVESMRLISD